MGLIEIVQSTGMWLLVVRGPCVMCVLWYVRAFVRIMSGVVVTLRTMYVGK